MNIQAINGRWFYDDVTARGVSFDGFLPQACKTPLGNMQDFELIHSPEKMAEFQTNDWYRKNVSLGDTLLTFSSLNASDKHVLIDAYREGIGKILSKPCDSECCNHDAADGAWPALGSCRGMNTLQQDLSRYGDVMTGSNDLDDGKFYDVKKEIYRLTDRVFAALAKCYEIDANGAFAILDELHRKEIISSEARDNFESASASAIKLRISTYIKANKQGEQLITSPQDEPGKLTSSYYMPNEEELFHFFFVAIPLYEELKHLKTAGSIPPSLTHCSFYDDSDLTMGHIHCRLLNYREALKCYQSVLQLNSEKLDVEIRRIRIALFITKTAELADNIQENLNLLLGKIKKIFCQTRHCAESTVLESTPFVSILDMEECRQLLEILLVASSYYDCYRYFVLAEKILAQCALAEKNKPSGSKQLVMMKFAFLNFYTKHFCEGLVRQHQTDAVTSELTRLIDEEDVNSKCIVWLNKLGEFLFIQGKLNKAYRCFQRALIMEHLLYGTKANVNVMTSLSFLGMISMQLFMYVESRFYFEMLLRRFESFGGPSTILMIKHTYLQLALLSVAMEYSVQEKTVQYLEKGLKITTGKRNDSELILDCVLFSQLAAILQAQNNSERALQSVFDAKASLSNIVGMQSKVAMTCLLSMSMAEIKKTDEGIVMLKEEIEKLTSMSMEQKAYCMMCLGKLCEKQGLVSDAENYYRQALLILAATKNDKNSFDILECLIGISKAIIMQSRVSEAITFLDQAFNIAKKLSTSKKKCSFLEQIGELYRNLPDILGARQCFEEALRTCEESNITEKLPFTEFMLLVKLGELANEASADVSTNPKIAIPFKERVQAQRNHYDRAGEVLQQHVGTGQVDSTTVILFFSLALKFTSIDLNEKIKLLLKALQVGEIVYGTSKPSEMVNRILEQLSDTFWMTGDMQASARYRERLLNMEMELHLSNPFHDHISHNLTILSFCVLENPCDSDTVQRLCERFRFAQKDVASEDHVSKAAAARCFTILGVLFYTLGHLEEAKTWNKEASELFNEIQLIVHRGKLLGKDTCDVMKKLIIDPPVTQTILPSDKKELSKCIMEMIAADSGIKVECSNLFKQSMNTRSCSEFKNGKELPTRSQLVVTEKNSVNFEEQNSLQATHKNLQVERSSGHPCNQKHHKEQLQSTLVEDPNSHSSFQSFDGINTREIVSSDSKDINFLTHTLSQIPIPVNLNSFPDALVNPQSIKSTTDYLCQKLEVIQPQVSAIATLYDAVEYNKKKGDMQQTLKIATSLQSQMLSCLQNFPFDNVEQLISQAIEEKEKNIAIRRLDLALQLPSNWRRKTKILKLRAKCYLSLGDCLTAAISFKEAIRFQSSETLQELDDQREYLEMLIGLIKSKMLYHDLVAAHLICQEGITWVADHELEGKIYAAEVELFYLDAKCLAILSESADNKDDMLAQACSLCQAAVTLGEKNDQIRKESMLMKETETPENWIFVPLKCEVQLLLATVFLKLGEKEKAKKVCNELKEILMNMAAIIESNPSNPLAARMPESRLFSWIGRVLAVCDDMEPAITWLSKSLSAFFSHALPDVWSLFEEFLPLLHAVTLIKFNTVHESRSPFQQAIDMCKEASVKHGNDLNNFYAFLRTLVKLYMNFGQTEEAIVVAKTGLRICDFLSDSHVIDRMNNRNRMLLFLAQIHQLNSVYSAIDRNKELKLAEEYYLIDRGSTTDFGLKKDLSYANFLCNQKRYVEADAVLQDISNLGQLVWNKLLFCHYFARELYGPGVQKSVQIHGELMVTVGDIMYSTKVRVLVGMEKKREAVAACETLAANSVFVHETFVGKRPSCYPYLIEACQRELLSLVKEDDRKQLEDCDFPLLAANLAKLYYMLNEYTLAIKYCPEDVKSAELIDMKISCFRLAGNNLVEISKGDESYSNFVSFLLMLQRKEAFLEKPFHTQCAILEGYSFANPYYVFRSLGKMQCVRGNLGGAIQCYERCLDLDEDLTCDENLVATLAELYQSKALTVDKNDDKSCERQMNTALNLFQELFQKTGKLTAFVECSFASLLSRLERYKEAVEHFENVIKRADEKVLSFAKEDAPLLDVYLRREIEASGRIEIPIKVRAFYELILTYLKLNELEKAQNIAFQLEDYVARFHSTSTYSLVLSVLGYTYKLIGNKEKAAEIFVTVLEIIPGHLPVSKALESCCM